MSDPYRDVFERAIAQALALPRRRSPAAAEPQGRLLSRQPQERRRILIANSSTFRTPELCEWLIDHSMRLRYEDPRLMIRTASAAVEVAESLSGLPTEAISADLQAESWGALSNAYRILGNLKAAEECMSRAARHLDGGSGDPLLVARLGTWRGNLKQAERALPRSLRLYRAAFRTYMDLSEFHAAGRVVLMMAIALAYSDQPNEAMECLAASFRLVDIEMEPAIGISALHTMAYLLAQEGRAGDARKMIRVSHPLYASVPGRLAALRLVWMEGRVLASAGLLSEAEACLLRVREGFVRKGMAYDAALASLDLAGIYLETREPLKVAALAQEMHAVFSRQGLGEQATASLLLLAAAAREQSLSREVIAGAAAAVRQARCERFSRS